jgi:hypothetical protein
MELKSQLPESHYTTRRQFSQYALYSRELLLSVTSCYYATVLTWKGRPIKIQAHAFKRKIIAFDFTVLEDALYFVLQLKALFQYIHNFLKIVKLHYRLL